MMTMKMISKDLLFEGMGSLFGISMMISKKMKMISKRKEKKKYLLFEGMGSLLGISMMKMKIIPKRPIKDSEQ